MILKSDNIDSVGLSIVEQAETGFSLARDIDTQVRSIKRGNMIRRKMNLPIEKTVKIPKDQLQTNDSTTIFVDKEGSMDTEGHLVNYIEFGVRPAMWINLVEEPE